MATQIVMRVVLMLSALLFACGDEPRRTVSTGGPSAFSDEACTASTETCDIAEKDCQQRILEVTACVRGDTVPDLPKIRTLTQDAFRDELLAQAEQMQLEPGPWDTAFTLFGFMEPGMSSVEASIEDTVTSVAAYYDDRDMRVTVIESAMPDDARTRMFILSHELTHYLQDLNMDLGALRESWVINLDSDVALSSLVEGDAVVTSTRVSALWAGERVGSVLWDEYFDGMQDAMFEQIGLSVTPLFTAQQSLPYPIGGRYVAYAWNDHNRAYVDGLYDDASPFFVDWLSGYDGNPGRTLVQRLDCAPPLPPEGLTAVGLDMFGPTGIIALLTLDDGWLDDDERALAEALRDDAFVVYATTAAASAPTVPAAAAWRLRFATQADAAAFASAVQPLDLGITSLGTELLLTAHSPTAPSFPADAESACPTFDALFPPETRNTMSASPRLLPRHRH